MSSNVGTFQGLNIYQQVATSLVGSAEKIGNQLASSGAPGVVLGYLKGIEGGVARLQGGVSMENGVPLSFKTNYESGVYSAMTFEIGNQHYGVVIAGGVAVMVAAADEVGVEQAIGSMGALTALES